MRPSSIIQFERLFLGSIVLGLVNNALTWHDLVNAVGANPDLQRLGVTPSAMIGVVIGLLALGIVINLVLWFLVARRGSNIAKWILTVLTALGIVSMMVSGLGHQGLTLPMVLTLAALALQIAAIFELFRRDAVEWLHGPRDLDTK